MSTTPITTVCVLGMHRSGTSCLAGSLQAAGLPGGKVMKYCIHNTKGSRENQSINDLNESIFTSNNGSWYEPPATIQYSAKHQQHRDRIVADLNSQFPVWMFKDPRTVLTLPFWQEKIPNLQLVASFRQPLKVAMSLYQRQSLQIPLREGIELWIHYNSLILKAYKKENFPLICFDLPQDEYLAKLSEVINYLNTKISSDTKLSATKVRDFYESNLVRQEKTLIVSPKKEDRLLLERAESLYRELRKTAGLPINSASNNQNLLRISLEEDSASYLKTIKTQPDNPQLYFMLAKAQEDEGNIEAAISSSRKALSLDCYSVDFVEQLSRLLSHTGNFSEAASVIESLIQHQPDNPRLYINLGNIRRSQRDFASAVLAFQKTLELIPDNALSLMRVSNILIQDNRIEEAISSCKKALELYPQNPQVYFTLGKAYARQGDCELAIICYQKSIGFCTSSPGNVYFHLGNALKKQSKISEALEAYKDAIKLESNSYYGYFGLANYYQEQNKSYKAILLYKKAIELECKNAQVYFRLGQSLQKQEKRQKAILLYKKAIELNPQHFQANIELASCYRNLKQWDRAIQIYQKTLELNPENSKVYWLLGQIFVEQENWNQAIASCQKALNLNHPNLFGVYKLMGDALTEISQIDRAIAAYEKAIAIRPNSLVEKSLQKLRQ